MRLLQSYILFSIGIVFFLTSCSGIKYLEKKKIIKKDEYLLFKQNVKGNKALNKDKYTSFYQQRTNKKLPLLGSKPYFYFYILGSSLDFKDSTKKEIEEATRYYNRKIAEDSAKGKKERVKKWIVKKERKLEKLQLKLREGNAFSRTFGEAPAIAKKEYLERTAVMMSQMLKAKGYYHNKVIPVYDTNGKKLSVVYRVSEGEPHKINSIKYTVANKEAQSLIDQTVSQSVLKPNKKLDESELVAERDRLDKLLKNHGYYDFDKQFIFCRVDTNAVPYKADVEFVIDTAVEKNIFKRYTIKEVVCHIEYNKFKKGNTDTLYYDKIKFVQVSNKYGKKVIAGKIKFRPGDPYSMETTVNSQLNLSNLDNFKFTNIRYLKTGKDDSTLVAEIILNSNKKYQIVDEWGLNVTQGLPGPMGSISFLNRNILRGCENFDASVRYGIEGVASATNPDIVYKSVEAAADVGMTFPQFYIPTKLRFKFNNYFPRTRLNFAFNNVVRPEFARRNFKLALNYTLTRNTFSRYIFSIADLNIVQTDIRTKAYQDYLDLLTVQGSTFPKSLQPAFVSSIHITYLFNNNDFTRFTNGTFLRIFVESGGTTQHLLEREFKRNGLIQDNMLFGKLSYYKFLKFNVDYRTYHSVLPKSQVAFRINTGIAFPFDGALPYEKYFFAGGSSSLRAWLPRRLGPGSRLPTMNRDSVFDYKFEQPAEILIEANIESRFKIVKFIEGALFVDAGNVWRLTKKMNSEAPEDFNPFRFVREIAVGSGFGLRFNFTFIIIRFDLGLKVYDPAFSEKERFVVRNWNLRNVFATNQYGILNLGIGYPF